MPLHAKWQRVHGDGARAILQRDVHHLPRTTERPFTALGFGCSRSRGCVKYCCRRRRRWWWWWWWRSAAAAAATAAAHPAGGWVRGGVWLAARGAADARRVLHRRGGRGASRLLQQWRGLLSMGRRPHLRPPLGRARARRHDRAAAWARAAGAVDGRDAALPVWARGNDGNPRQ